MSEGQPAGNPIFDSSPKAPSAPAVALDPERVQAYLQELESQQNLLGAIAGGFVSAIVGAVIWAAVTVTTEYQIGWMAVGLGFLVGLAVKKYGKGLSMRFGVVGGVLSLFGSLLGNVLSYEGLQAKLAGLPILAAEMNVLLNPVAAGEALIDWFTPVDLLFYGIAVYEGYKFSFHEISQGELAALASSSGRENDHA